MNRLDMFSPLSPQRLRDEIIRLKRTKVQTLLQRKATPERQAPRRSRLHDYYQDEVRRQQRKGMVNR